MSTKPKTPFTDKFFQISHRVTYFVLGKDQQSIFENFRDIDLDSDDSYRLFIATGIDPAKNRCIGVFDEPTVVCGQLYPKSTVAVFQGREPGSRFALFSVDEIDAQQ